jgi:uncharacterized membrane protein YhiD involved in acid resistance
VSFGGSPAGDRTLSLIGTASAVLGNLAGAGSPNAIAGAVTGIGFIGGGIVFRRTVRSGQMIDGITTAAAVFATAAIGAAAGAGLLAVAALATALVLIALEGPHPASQPSATAPSNRQASRPGRTGSARRSQHRTPINCSAEGQTDDFKSPTRTADIAGRDLRVVTICSEPPVR